MKYMVRTVSRDPNGKVTDIADTWPLNATTVEGLLERRGARALRHGARACSIATRIR